MLLHCVCLVVLCFQNIFLVGKFTPQLTVFQNEIVMLSRVALLLFLLSHICVDFSALHLDCCVTLFSLIVVLYCVRTIGIQMPPLVHLKVCDNLLV